MSEQAESHNGNKVLYTGRTQTVGGREHGSVRSSDGNLEIKLSTPGSGRAGTNPEQLFSRRLVGMLRGRDRSCGAPATDQIAGRSDDRRRGGSEPRRQRVFPSRAAK